MFLLRSILEKYDLILRYEARVKNNPGLEIGNGGETSKAPEVYERSGKLFVPDPSKTSRRLAMLEPSNIHARGAAYVGLLAHNHLNLTISGVGSEKKYHSIL